MGFITSFVTPKGFNTPGCMLAFIKQSARTSVIESVNEETAIKEATEGLLYRVNSLRVGKSFPTLFLSLPPRLSESRSDCVPGRRSPALLFGCRGSVASPWQPPPADIPAAPAGKARLQWTAWSAHSPCSRTATDTNTQKPLLSHSTGTFYVLTEYTFTDALINQQIFHMHTPLLTFGQKQCFSWNS